MARKARSYRAPPALNRKPSAIKSSIQIQIPCSSSATQRAFNPLLTLFSLPPRPIQVFSLACKPDQAENNSQTQIPQMVELCWEYGDKGNMKASNCRAAAGCYYTSGQGEEKQARKDSCPFLECRKRKFASQAGESEQEILQPARDTSEAIPGLVCQECSWGKDAGGSRLKGKGELFCKRFSLGEELFWVLMEHSGGRGVCTLLANPAETW